MPGLRIVEVVQRLSHSTVYRAVHGGRSYDVEVLDPVDEERLRHACRQAATLARARHAALPRVLTVGRLGAAAYVVRERLQGQTLATALQAGLWPEASIVRLGRTLGGALAAAHRLGLVHRGIKPENILLRGDSGEPTLVGFDLLAPMERRSVDPRSDLYSLGAVLFECATGQAAPGAAGPLAGGDQVAEGLTLRDLNPNISAALSAVIAKLLAPNPEQRYPSAELLVHDLDLPPLLEQDAEPRSTAQDFSPSMLLGRDDELATLQQCWQEALRERGQAVVVRGPAGSGKTHLAQVFLEEVGASGRLVLAGRCGEGETLPFGALRTAMDVWLESLGQMASAPRMLAEQRLRIAAGDFAGLLKLFSSGFGLAFEGVPRAAESEFLHERFYDILAEFLLKLAGCYGGLTLFIDEIQWLDSSSREVLSRVGARLEGAPLLVLATARTDVHGSAAHARTRDVFGTAPRSVLPLAPLSEAASGQLTAALLGVADAPPDVASHVASWTSGNPLALTEYVQALVEAEVLRPQWGSWVLDGGDLERLQLPGDVANLVAARVRLLGPPATAVLRTAALLGARVRVEELTAVAGESEVEQELAEAQDAQLIRDAGPGEVEFSHDSVREALIADLSGSDLQDIHQRIAEALSHLPQEGQRVFAVARHFALGHAAADWPAVHATSLAAGLAAMASLADADAYEFLEQAAGAADAAAIPHGLVLEEALGEVCARTGRWDEALVHLAAALDLSTDPLRRAGLRARLARVHIANRQTLRAWREVEHGFADMGNPLGRSLVARLLYSAWCWLIGLLSLRVRLGYGAARGHMRARLQTLSQLYVIGAYAAYLLHDNARLLEMVVRQLYSGHLLGDSAEMASALTSYANLLAILRRRETAEKYSARATAMAVKLGDRFLLARLRMFHAWQQHVGGRPRQGEIAMRRCLQVDSAWLDAADLAYGHIDLAWNLTLRGYWREALELIEAAQSVAQPDSGESCNLEIKAVALRAVLGRLGEAPQQLGQLRDRVLQPDASWLHDGYFSYLTLVLLEQGELGPPLEEALREYRAGAPSRSRQTAFHGRHFFVFQAYARLEQCMRDSSAANVERLEAAVAALRPIASHPTLRSHYLVLRASTERFRDRPRRALRELLAAQEAAFEADNTWALFEIHRQLAHTLSALDNHEPALRQARLAYLLAATRGWTNRVHLIRAEFNSLRPGVEGDDQAESRAAAERDPERLEQHLESLLQVSLAASSTLDPARQAQVALDEILRVLQAQRAFLFAVNAYGELQLRAGRSFDGEDLPDLTGYSRTIVESVRTSHETVIVGATEHSLQAPDLRSILAAPLMMRGQLLGVVYVDSQLAYGAFTEDDVRILTAIANHIAIALQNAGAVAQQTALTRANSDLLEALRLQVHELKESRRQITAAEERLRREIAEILHSRVQSKLVVATHQLAQAAELIDRDPAEARRLLAVSQAQLEEVGEREIRDASHLLHPSIIRIGLGPAVRSLVSRFDDMFRITLDVSRELSELDTIVDSKLPEDVRLAAYRAVEEALTNVARHAHASQIEITLAVAADRQLVIAVRDDGVGFESSQLQPGLGLSSIDGRLKQLGGSWLLTSQPGQGSTLEVRLPLA